MNKTVALLSLVIILFLVNWSILGKEQQLAEGKIVYLELAPVDPRSLMQGDYMALRFQLADSVYKVLPKTDNLKQFPHETAPSDGYVIVLLDEQRIGSFNGLYSNQPLSDSEIILRYRVRNGEVKFGTNAYFFQEGHGKYYEPAKYGQFRVDNKGELLLTAMYDKNLKKLGPESQNPKPLP